MADRVHIGRESSVIGAIRRRAKKHSPDLLLRKYHGSEFGLGGEPDLYGCYRGRAFAVEAKRPGEEPSRLQLERLKEWAAAGAITGVAHSAAEFFKLLGMKQ